MPPGDRRAFDALGAQPILEGAEDVLAGLYRARIEAPSIADEPGYGAGAPATSGMRRVDRPGKARPCPVARR
ncbi:MAG: hypothetical protein CL931_16680 [Deltaproteobacteria bacterium]|nr:hypothetical protein [Deltaproteobacteria bacterium]